MKCPVCGKFTFVLETRLTSKGVTRRRECGNEHRFTTLESVVFKKKQTEVGA